MKSAPPGGRVPFIDMVIVTSCRGPGGRSPAARQHHMTYVLQERGGRARIESQWIVHFPSTGRHCNVETREPSSELAEPE